MRTIFALLVTVLASLPASAQKLDLDLTALAKKAAWKNEVSLDGGTLDLSRHMGAVLKQDDNDKLGDLGKLLSGIRGVVIRNYEFSKPGEYSDGDLKPLRRQVDGGSGWSRILNVKENAEHTEIYVYSQAGKTTGILLIAAEDKEVTVVHVLGSMELAGLPLSIEQRH